MIFNFALLCLWRIPLSLSFCNFHFPLFVLVRICLFLYLCICRRKHVSPKGAVTPTYHHQTNSGQRPDQPTSTTSTTYQNINIHHQHINIDNTSCKEQFQVWGSTDSICWVNWLWHILSSEYFSYWTNLVQCEKFSHRLRPSNYHRAWRAGETLARSWMLILHTARWDMGGAGGWEWRREWCIISRNWGSEDWCAGPSICIIIYVAYYNFKI